MNLLHELIWGPGTVCLVLVVGTAISVRTRFAQVRLLPGSLRYVGAQLRARPRDGVSPFQAVCTSLGTTVGTGNIAGVAGAITLGGPGAVFWMWVAGLLGMAVKYAETVLATGFKSGTASGPMGYLEKAFPKSAWVAKFYCLFGILGALGVGNTIQSATAVSALRGAAATLGLPFPGWLCPLLGVLLGLTVMAVLLGGSGRIGAVSELLIPVGALGYCLLCLGAILTWRTRLPAALGSILRGAFRPGAVTGGAVGSVFLAMQVGVSRGIFTNEAGLGASSIAHGEANTDPYSQGLMAIFEVFADTHIICTLTALAILTAPVRLTFGAEPGPELAQLALECTYGPWVAGFLALAICLFSFATVVGWGLYGGRFAEYLTGKSRWYLPVHCIFCALGGMIEPGAAWALAECANGLMAIPNLLGLWRLRAQVMVDKWGKRDKIGGNMQVRCGNEALRLPPEARESR